MIRRQYWYFKYLIRFIVFFSLHLNQILTWRKKNNNNNEKEE